MTIGEMLELLKIYEPTATIRFSVADDGSEDENERWFCEGGVFDHFGDEHEVTLCLLAASNLNE